MHGADAPYSPLEVPGDMVVDGEWIEGVEGPELIRRLQAAEAACAAAAPVGGGAPVAALRAAARPAPAVCDARMPGRLPSSLAPQLSKKINGLFG